MARASFQDATDPSMPSGSRTPSNGTSVASSRRPRWGRKAIQMATASVTRPTSRTVRWPVRTAKPMTTAITAHGPIGPTWVNRPVGPVRRRGRTVESFQTSGRTALQCRTPPFGTGPGWIRRGVGFEEAVRLLWCHLFWLLAFSLLAAIAVFIVGSLRSSTYTASAVLGVTPGVTPGQTVNNDTVAFATKYYERLVRSDSVLTSGAAAARPGTTLEDMRNRISTASTATDGTVTVKADASTADESVKVASAVANATIAQGRKDQEDERNSKISVLQQDRDAAKSQLDALAADSPDRARLEAQYQADVQAIADQQNAPF